MLPIDSIQFNVEELAAAWRSGRPFSHVVVDDFLADDVVLQLRMAVSREPHYPNRDELYEMMASAEPMRHPTLVEFAALLSGPEVLRAIVAISGKPVSSVEVRSYVYLAGSYLLPHTDYRASARRQVAYAYYLTGGDSVVGGELELFDCTMQGDEAMTTVSAKVIRPRENRLVLFDVSPSSLHQVREVLGGGRVSLAGWFFS